MSKKVLCTGTCFGFLCLALSSIAYADVFGRGSDAFEIQFVTVGQPGNPGDTTGSPAGSGSVDYTFRIGMYEIRAGFINKANAQSLADGEPLAITANSQGFDQPATSVTWFEAARFVNWLNTSTGNHPAYNFDGNGSFQLWEPTDPGYNPSNRYRNSLARYFLPNVDEWYKAAYFDPTSALYYDYPTASNVTPDGIDFPGDNDFDAAFDDSPSNILYLSDVDNVGLLSPFGTGGQGGNAWEWLETEFDLVNDSTLSRRIVRGGGASNGPSYMLRTSFISDPPDNQTARTGFRVASVPEPSSALAAFAAWALCTTSRFRRDRCCTTPATYRVHMAEY